MRTEPYDNQDGRKCWLSRDEVELFLEKAREAGTREEIVKPKSDQRMQKKHPFRIVGGIFRITPTPFDMFRTSASLEFSG
jgi:peptide subunit release factor 1 (eRF1)